MDNQEPQANPEEQAAWAALEAQAGAAVPSAAAQPVQPPGNQDDALLCTELLAASVEAAFPAVGFTDETKRDYASALEAVFSKYNFSFRFAAEINLAAKTAIIFAKCMKAHKAAQAEPAAPAAPVPPA